MRPTRLAPALHGNHAKVEEEDVKQDKEFSVLAADGTL